MVFIVKMEAAGVLKLLYLLGKGVGVKDGVPEIERGVLLMRYFLGNIGDENCLFPHKVSVACRERYYCRR